MNRVCKCMSLSKARALYSLADIAAGAASLAIGRDSVTLSGTINYIKPGRGGKLIGIAT